MRFFFLPFGLVILMWSLVVRGGENVKSMNGADDKDNDNKMNWTNNVPSGLKG